MRRLFVASVLGMVCIAAVHFPAVAAEWQVDEVHSNFYFTVDHIFSKVRGRFSDFQADVDFDPANPTALKMRFVIMTDSVDTDIAKRDKHLRSSEFFDAAQYPEMTFVSTSVSDLGSGNLEVKGTFVVKGMEHILVFPLHYDGIKEHPAVKGKKVIGLNGTLTLDRLKLGVGDGKFYKMGMLGREVEVLLTIEALSK